MSREKQLQQYKKFIENCTTVAKSVNNYSNFKKINECIGLLFPEKNDISILDFENPDDFKLIMNDLFEQEIFKNYNKVGNNQYSNALKRYWEFLSAKRWFSGKEKMNLENNCVNKDKKLQTIYYGTPGSGKSRKVKDIVKGVDENFVFRTTFHPDCDYASFVGCYKPVMEKLNERLYTEKELLDILKDFKVKGTNYPCQKFAFKYWNSLEILGSTIQKKILSSCDYNPDTYNTEISKGIALGKEFYNNKRSEIKYQFTPQTFTKAYVAAWNNPEQQIYLIIEEINRGNCAQIFGDLFQLLDRENGVSEYPIDADNDLKDYLEQELGAGHEGIKNGKLKLPSNLNILATMNTSDQSLFPMDSAFKRRWAWECVPVDYTNSDSGKFTIKIGDSEYKWHDFLLKANNRIKDLTFSEDKQMGNFFISSNVDKRQFIDKVMFYLWNDICKDEYGSGSFFRRNIDDNNPESEFSFNDLFGDDKKTVAILNGFMEYLAVEKIEAATSTGEEQ